MASAQALPAIRSLLQGSGDSSLEKEFLGAPVGPSVSTPNSQHSSPSRSLSGKCDPLPTPGTRQPRFLFGLQFDFPCPPFLHHPLLVPAPRLSGWEGAQDQELALLACGKSEWPMPARGKVKKCMGDIRVKVPAGPVDTGL